MAELDEGYVLPASKFQTSKDKNELLKRYQEDKTEIKTDQVTIINVFFDSILCAT